MSAIQEFDAQTASSKGHLVKLDVLYESAKTEGEGIGQWRPQRSTTIKPKNPSPTNARAARELPHFGGHGRALRVSD